MAPSPELDLETLVIAHLKADSDVTAIVPEEMISGRLRRELDPTDFALRVRRIGGLPTEQAASHLGRYRLQVDAFAPTELEAFTLAAAADVSIRSLEATSGDGVVVTAVVKDLALTISPDPDSDLARYLFGVVLYAHAAAA